VPPRPALPADDWTATVDQADTGVLESGPALDAWCALLGKDVEAVLLVPAPARGASGRVLVGVAVEPDSVFRTEDELLGRQFTQSLTLALENLLLLTE